MENQTDAPNQKMSQFLKACMLIDQPKAQHFILGVIFFNSLILGLETSPLIMGRVGWLLSALDACCLGIFVVEILMKLVIWRFSFFRSGWNIFDFFVVAICFVPDSGPFAILRALRVLRVLRLVTTLPRLRAIVEAVLRSLPSMAWICGLLLVIFYIFSVLATTLFGNAFPHWFGSIGASMYTLFQMLTLDSWSSGIVRPVMERFPYAYMLFIPYVLMTTFVVMNVFIGIIVSAMSEVAVANKTKEAVPAHGDKDGRKEMLEKELSLLKEHIARVEALLSAPDNEQFR